MNHEALIKEESANKEWDILADLIKVLCLDLRERWFNLAEEFIIVGLHVSWSRFKCKLNMEQIDGKQMK